MIIIGIICILLAKCSTATTADTAGETIPGWTMVMKLAHGQDIGEATSVHDLWTGTYSVNEGDDEAMSLATGTKTYRSSIVDNWADYSISVVRVSFVSGGKEKAFAVFDARGSDKKNWFSKSKILYSSWNDLNQQSTTNYDSIDGDLLRRHFYMNNRYGGCDNDRGWFVVPEGQHSNDCNWEEKTTKPYFLYSDASEYEKSIDQMLADVFVIWVSMDMCNPHLCTDGSSCTHHCACHENLLGSNCEHPIYLCHPNHCYNGPNCTIYQCTCTGNYFGTHCKDLNGGFSNWSSYGKCSETCGTGNKTRTRTCNNPTPVGKGSACSGDISETASCNNQPCPIDGGWSMWSGWGSCTKTCGGGTQQKIRTCTNPARQHGGADCANNPSTATASQACNTASCPTGCLNCSCQSHVMNMTSEKLLEVIAELKEELKIDKTQTSMNIRSKTSAKDSRTSAKMIGAVGVVMLATPFVIIILMDLITFYQFLNQKTQKRRKSKQKECHQESP